MDIRTVFFGFDQGADYALDALGLTEEDGLETAVVLSLFTDRRAQQDDPLPDGADRRGWWADGTGDDGRDRIGSRLWLLWREKQMPAVLVRARQYAEEALAWLVTDGVARRVDVQASNPRRSLLRIDVGIYRPDAPPVRYRFDAFWSAA